MRLLKQLPRFVKDFEHHVGADPSVRTSYARVAYPKLAQIIGRTEYARRASDADRPLRVERDVMPGSRRSEFRGDGLWPCQAGGGLPPTGPAGGTRFEAAAHARGLGRPPPAQQAPPARGAEGGCRRWRGEGDYQRVPSRSRSGGGL